MPKIEWWYDDQIWPGPPDQAHRLPWDDPFCDPRTAILRYSDEMGLGKTFTAFRTAAQQVIDGYKPLIEVLSKGMSNMSKAAETGRVRNHGPRTDQTFDRSGRRKY